MSISRGKPYHPQVPYPLTQLVDKRIGDTYPVVEAVANSLPAIAYLAENLHLVNFGGLELRGNSDIGAVEWRKEDSSLGSEEGWRVLFYYSELGSHITQQNELLIELYAIIKRQGERLEKELDYVKSFVGYDRDYQP